MASPDYCIPGEQTAAATDMGAMREEIWESFKLAFEAQVANGTQDEWQSFEDAEGYLGYVGRDWGKPDQWFGSGFDSKGESVHPSDYQKEGSVKLYDWKKRAITDASFANLKATFGCNVNPNGMMAVASAQLDDWLSAQANAFARADALGGDTSGVGGDELAAADAAAIAMVHGDTAEERAAGAAGTIAGIDAAKAKADEAASIIRGEYSDIEFKEQCFLLAKIFDLWEHKVSSETREIKPLPYVNGAPNASLMADDNPYGFMNRLTQYPTQQKLMDMDNGEISNLQPRIRLFKVTTDKEGVESSQEINFDAHATQQDIELMLAKQGKRGFGAGIKDFTFAYEANNPFALKKSISAKLTIFANTFDELLRDRSVGSEPEYRYVDLALKTGGDSSTLFRKQNAGMSPQDAEVAAANLSKLDFRLKAVVGLEMPITTGGISDFPSTSALQNSFVTLNLTPTTHEFEFDEMGRVNFAINYLAYVEDFFDQPSFSIFGSLEVAKALYQRQLQMKIAAASCSSEQVKQFKEDQAASMQSTKNLAFTYLFKQLTINNKLRYISIPFEQLQEFNTKGPFYELSQGAMTNLDVGDLSNSQKLTFAKEVQEELASKNEAPATEDQPVDPEEEIQRTISRIAPRGDEEIVFFYVSDLVDVILSGIEQKLKPEENGSASGMHQIIDELTSGISGSDANAAGSALALQIEQIQAEADAAAAAGDYATESDLLDQLDVLEADLRAQALSTGSAEEQAAAILAVGDFAIEEKKRFVRLYDNFKKLRVLLGPVEIVNPRDPSNSAFVNFGDMPVSAKYFMDWLTEKVLKKEEFYYPLPRFLNDFFNLFVRDFLNNDTCFGYSVKQKTRVQQAAVTAYGMGETDNADNVTAEIVKQREENGTSMISRLMMWNMTRDTLPVLNISGYVDDPRSFSRHLSHEFNYLVYFAGRTQPLEKMNGDVAEDGEQGIMHYMLGRDEGIIKNISLRRTEAPGLKEVRFEQEGFDGLNQLREVYDVEIETYANVSALPGVYLFVDPRGFVPNMDYSLYEKGFNINDLSDYGLGGYYMIIRSEHSFGPGKAQSTITAKWVAEIHKNVDASEGETAEGSAAPSAKPTKCYMKASRRKEEDGYMSMLAMSPGFDGSDDVDTGEIPPMNAD